MKKKLFVLFLAVVMMLVITAAVSAADSRSGYYSEINDIILRIEDAFGKDNIKLARRAMNELRLKVYECSHFLIRNESYDERIFDVIRLADNAFIYPSQSLEWLQKARALAAEILIDPEEVDYGSGSSHS